MRARIVAVVPLLFAAPGSLSDAPGAAPVRHAAASVAHARAQQVQVTILSIMLAGDSGRDRARCCRTRASWGSTC